MNSALQALQRLHPSHLRQHPMFRDQISVVALGAALSLNTVTLFALLMKVHQVDYPVPTHYVSLVGFDRVGAWYEDYRIAVFGFAITLANAFLAGKAFHRNRLVSFFLLLGAVAVALLCLVIGRAFAVLI